MKNIFRRIFCLVLVGIFTTFCFSCKKKPDEEVVVPNYTLDEYEFSTVFTDGESKTLEEYAETTTHEEGAIVYDARLSSGLPSGHAIESISPSSRAALLTNMLVR